MLVSSNFLLFMDVKELGAKEMAQWLKALAVVLLEDQGLIPSTHMATPDHGNMMPPSSL